MSYNADENFPQVDRVFAACMYPAAQRRLIYDNVGKNPATVMQTVTPEDLDIHRHTFRDVLGKDNKVVDDAEAQYQQAFANAKYEVECALRRFYDLDDMAENGVQQWVGTEAVRKAIETWEEREQRREEVKRQNPRGFAHHPEMFEYRGERRLYQGKGSDVGRPRRYDLELFETGTYDPSDFTAGLGDEKPADAEVYDFRRGPDWVGCPVCSYQKKFDPGSTASLHRAESAVRMHMQNVGDQKEEHQEALRRLGEPVTV